MSDYTFDICNKKNGIASDMYSHKECILRVLTPQEYTSYCYMKPTNSLTQHIL